jgi:hypothetical protein
VSTATGIRTPVSAVRGRRPSPLDDGGAQPGTVAAAHRAVRVRASPPLMRHAFVRAWSRARSRGASAHCRKPAASAQSGAEGTSNQSPSNRGRRTMFGLRRGRSCGVASGPMDASSSSSPSSSAPASWSVCDRGGARSACGCAGVRTWRCSWPASGRRSAANRYPEPVPADVAKLVYAQASGACERKLVEVRVLSSALSQRRVPVTRSARLTARVRPAADGTTTR